MHLFDKFSEGQQGRDDVILDSPPTRKPMPRWRALCSIHTPPELPQKHNHIFDNNYGLVTITWCSLRQCVNTMYWG